MLTIAAGQNLRKIWDELAKNRADHDFLIYEDPATGLSRRWTYGQFNQEINQLGNGLLHSGIQKGQCVGIQMQNKPEFLLAMFAVQKIGAVAVPINPAYLHEETQYILQICNITTVFSDLEYEPQYREIFERTTSAQYTLVLFESNFPVQQVGRSQIVAFEDYTTNNNDLPTDLPALSESDLAEIMFTSGTTSKPKGVMLTHANFVFSGYFLGWQLGMNEDDIYATTMTVAHVNFQLSALTGVLISGSTLVLFKRYSARRFWKRVLHYRATLVQGMAMIARTMMLQPSFAGENRHHVRHMHYFLPISPDEKKRFEQRFGVRLLNSYGSTETLVGVVSVLPTGEQNWPSIGRVAMGYEVGIFDETGRALGSHEYGEIWVKGEVGVSIMAGYYSGQENLSGGHKKTDSTAEPLGITNGWFRTGDIGFYDEDGWFYFVDRRSGIIKKAGENVSATEIENVIMGLPAVAEVGVVGVADPIRDQRIKAVVRLHEGKSITEEEIIAWCESQLSYFKVPDLVEFREELPHSEYNKICRNLL